MRWKYEQPAGNMYKNSRLIESGYSGPLINRNNPGHQQAKGLGLLPCGTHKIAGHSTSKRPVTIILEQTSGEAFGCSEFCIHGECKHDPAGFVSEGRIILSLATQRLVLRNGGDLEVVR